MISKAYWSVVPCIVLTLCFHDIQINNKYLFVKCSKFDSLPIKGDLIKYLRALNRVIAFYEEHKSDIDINIYFGLFLANVNLKRGLEEKQHVLPRNLYVYMKEIIQKTESILDLIKNMIGQSQKFRNNQYKSIMSLFMNSTRWIYRLPKFQTTRLYEAFSYFEKDWIVHKQNIDDRNAWIPTPYQSDVCLASLASAQLQRIGISQKCKVFKPCYDMVKNGTDFGYALAHRLLFLQQATFAVGCNVFSAEEDMALKRRFCSAAYEEAVYIASYDFEIVDLLLEHVCLCALEGNAQFLKRSWLKTILSFQTPSGCFSPYSQISMHNVHPRHALNTYCNGHTSAVAAGTLAMASRFILEYHY